MSDKVLVVITTPDGRPDHEIMRYAQAACDYEPRAELTVVAQNHSVAACRNKAVVQVLASAEYSHLMFIDNDVPVQEDAISLLLDLDADIATGCVPMVFGDREPALALARHDFEDGSYDLYRSWFSDVREVAGCGGACLLIKRAVLESLEFPWFEFLETIIKGQHVFGTEDFPFCRKARDAGYRIMAHGLVRCGHYKRHDLASRIKEEWEPREASSWRGPVSISDKTHGAKPRHGSHVPALREIARRTTVKNAVEFGCGVYSTPTMLDREVFPDLERLTSHESDERWMHYIDCKSADRRLTVNQCELEAMPSVVNGEKYDLVFIDCGAKFVGRESDYSTRIELLERFTDSDSVVVLHDIEDESLGRAFDAAKYSYKARFTPDGEPHTGVASNSFDVSAMA